MSSKPFEEPDEIIQCGALLCISSRLRAVCLALLLLMARILANHHHAALALDDLALFANGFD